MRLKTSLKILRRHREIVCSRSSRGYEGRRWWKTSSEIGLHHGWEIPTTAWSFGMQAGRWWWQVQVLERIRKRLLMIHDLFWVLIGNHHPACLEIGNHILYLYLYLLFGCLLVLYAAVWFLGLTIMLWRDYTGGLWTAVLSSVSYFEDRRIFVGTLNLLRRETALSFPVSASVVTPANPTNLVLCLKNEKTNKKVTQCIFFSCLLYIIKLFVAAKINNWGQK